MPDPSSLPLARLRRDGGTQMRAQLTEEQATHYASLIREDVAAGRPIRLPPVDVFHDGKDYWLAHGFHRWEGHQQAGERHILCIVHAGTRRDAVLHAVGCNATNGVHRSKADKDRALAALLSDPEWSQWNDSEIARRCHVDRETVARHRRHLRDATSEKRKYRTKHGTEAAMNTGQIGQAVATDDPRLESLIPELRAAAVAGEFDDEDLDELAAMNMDRQRELVAEGSADRPRLPTLSPEVKLLESLRRAKLALADCEQGPAAFRLQVLLSEALRLAEELTHA